MLERFSTTSFPEPPISMDCIVDSIAREDTTKFATKADSSCDEEAKLTNLVPE